MDNEKEETLKQNKRNLTHKSGRDLHIALLSWRKLKQRSSQIKTNYPTQISTVVINVQLSWQWR